MTKSKYRWMTAEERSILYSTTADARETAKQLEVLVKRTQDDLLQGTDNMCYRFMVGSKRWLAAKSRLDETIATITSMAVACVGLLPKGNK